MEHRNQERAALQALLLTDRSVIPKGNRISFASTSEQMIANFCEAIYAVYGLRIPKERIGFGKGTRQRLYLLQLRSKYICSDLLKDMIYKTKGTDVDLPKYWFELPNEGRGKLLRYAFDADGGCSLRVTWLRKKHCFGINREVFLACKNLKLRKQFRLLIDGMGIKTGESSDKITITSRRDIEIFKNLIGFSAGVNVGFDSRFWHGIEKRKLLDIILKSYHIPRGFLQTFGRKEEFYNHMASFQVNTVRES